MGDESDMEQTAVCVPKFLEPYSFEPKRLFVFGQDSSSDRTSSTDRDRGTSSTIAAEEAGTERREEASLQLEGVPAERLGNTDWCLCESCSPNVSQGRLFLLPRVQVYIGQDVRAALYNPSQGFLWSVSNCSHA